MVMVYTIDSMKLSCFGIREGFRCFTGLCFNHWRWC